MKKNNIISSILSFAFLCSLSAQTFTVQALPNNDAAGDYAYRFYKNYNSSYTSYDGRGGDCANFASQCLGEGKLDHKHKSSRYDSDAVEWWYNFYNHTSSPSWRSTSRLAKHLQYRGCSYKTYKSSSTTTTSLYNMFSAASTGDVVICSDFDPNVSISLAYHTYFVGGINYYKEPDGTPAKRVTLMAHTNDMKYDIYLDFNKAKISSIYGNDKRYSDNFFKDAYKYYRLEKTSNLSK